MNSEQERKPIGELLKEKGFIGDEHIKFALQQKAITNEKMGEILVRLTFVTEYDVAKTLCEQDGIPYVDVDEVVPDEAVLKLFNKNLCLTQAFLPIAVKENGFVMVAAADVSSPSLAQLITRNSGLKPCFYLCERGKLLNAINKFYYFFENPIEKLIRNEVNLLSHDSEMARGMDNLLKYILELAVKMRATDVHIRPMENSTHVAFRVDGVIQPIWSFPGMFKRIVSTIKMKAEMDIAEQRLPQDGRFTETVLNNGYDYRVSTIISPFGENVVLRVLPTESALMGMEQLGFLRSDIDNVKELFSEPFGIVLLTGPTGSGKSTTLYAGIRSLNLLEKNVVTVEEPIEYHVPLLRQTQVNEKAGYTFANAIRYFLRHDPDVILVGEIRDRETAATAVTASTTGHLVLSTMHTNNALGALPRLQDLGIRPFLIADSLIGVVSQRLVRRICNHCKESYKADEWEKTYLKDPSITELYRGVGCEVCNGSGYFGRTLVYECLMVDRELSRLIDNRAELNVILDKAKENGFVDIFATTVTKVKAGVTTAEEAVRVLGNVRYLATDAGTEKAPLQSVVSFGPSMAG